MSLERLVLWCQPNRVSEVFSSDRVSPGCRHVLGHWNRRRRHRSRRHCHYRPSCARAGFAGVAHAVLNGCLLVDPKWTHGVRYKPAEQTQRRVWVSKGFREKHANLFKVMKAFVDCSFATKCGKWKILDSRQKLISSFGTQVKNRPMS